MFKPNIRTIGLTGGMAMGKSTASRFFMRHHVPVHDSDASVHLLMQHGGKAYNWLASTLPHVVEEDAVNRRSLAQYVQSNPDFLKVLEEHIHPMVYAHRQEFLHQQKLLGKNFVILDIPLLFEVKLHHICDAIIVMDCPIWQQKQRIMLRKDMTAEKMHLLLARQWNNEQRKRHADYIVQTGLGFDYSYAQLRRILQKEQ